MKIMDNRSNFANHVLQILYDRYDGDIKDNDFLEELNELYAYFDEYVRNIYECFEDEIPLFLYRDYLKARGPNDIYCERFEDMSIPDILVALEEEIHEFHGADDE